MTINRKRNLVVSVEDGGTFEVVLHRVWRGSAVRQDFLGFYVLDSHRMSARTHGLLGMYGWPGWQSCGERGVRTHRGSALRDTRTGAPPTWPPRLRAPKRDLEMACPSKRL